EAAPAPSPAPILLPQEKDQGKDKEPGKGKEQPTPPTQTATGQAPEQSRLDPDNPAYRTHPPEMIGDPPPQPVRVQPGLSALPGTTSGAINAPGGVTIAGIPIAANGRVAIPGIAGLAVTGQNAVIPSARMFKISDNGSARPQDRVYFSFNSFSDLNAAA